MQNEVETFIKNLNAEKRALRDILIDRIKEIPTQPQGNISEDQSILDLTKQLDTIDSVIKHLTNSLK